MHNKGGVFERRMATEFSLWWSRGESETVFWRTAGSGARATSRTKRGKKTPTQHGDLCAVEEVGNDFLKFVTVELKRGYGKASVADLLDNPNPLSGKEQLLEEWVRKAKVNAKFANTVGWVIVHQRDRRLPVVYFPSIVVTSLWDHRGGLATAVPFLTMSVNLQSDEVVDGSAVKKEKVIYATTLGAWFRLVDPDVVRAAVEEQSRRKLGNC